MVSTEPLVLIVDDEMPIRRFLRVSLAGERYRVVEAATAAEALEQIAAQRPDVVVLDLGLPDRDGVVLIREIREWSSVPIVVLSVRDRESDKVSALETGADDYLTKPFSVGELLARLRVALRHAAIAGGTAIAAGVGASALTSSMGSLGGLGASAVSKVAAPALTSIAGAALTAVGSGTVAKVPSNTKVRVSPYLGPGVQEQNKLLNPPPPAGAGTSSLSSGSGLVIVTGVVVLLALVWAAKHAA